jgi:hypothetical protein
MSGKRPPHLRIRAGRAAVVAAIAGTAFLAAGASGAASAATPRPVASSAASCPTTVNASEFASAKELRRLNAKIASFGLRSPGSDASKREVAWIQSEMKKIPGVTLRSQSYSINRWQPTTRTKGKPGRDLAEAGGLSVDGSGNVPVAGALPYTLPTSSLGTSAPLSYVPIGQRITADNARGKIVIQEMPNTGIPFALFKAVGHYLTPDSPSEGDYVRPYLNVPEQSLFDAGKVGAAGIVFIWGVPGTQVSGYFDPHGGTKYRVPSVWVGNEQGAALKQAAQAGRTATITVRAKRDTATVRNVFATLRGRSRERIVVLTHTDGNTWVQDNGSVGLITLARNLAKLRKACRARDVEFAFTNSHLSYTKDGANLYAAGLDRDYDKGKVAFGVTMEHMGTREILPEGPNNKLAFTGKSEPIAWSVAAELPALVKASVAAVKRRKLDRTVVIKGVGLPVQGQVPSICSYGGIGGSLNWRLIPSIATISGPWSLWAPSFGAKAVDFKRMRKQILAQGDVIRGLDRVSRENIAGGFTEGRRQRAAGTVKTCSLEAPPAEAPAS